MAFDSPATCLSVVVFVAIVGLLSTSTKQVECQEQLTVEARTQKDADELTDTIKLLEKLDKYYSQIARPRFGRSQYKQPVGTLMGTHRSMQSGGNSALNARPFEASARLDSLADLINSRLSKKYLESNY